MNCAVRSVLALSIVCGLLVFGPGASAFPSIVDRSIAFGLLARRDAVNGSMDKAA